MEELQLADSKGDYFTTWKIIHDLSGKDRNPKVKVKMRDGAPPKSDKDLLAEWQAYFSSLLNNDNGQAPSDLPQPAAQDLPIHDHPLTLEETLEAIRQMKTNKAAGPDCAITVEALQGGGDAMADVIHCFCAEVYSNLTPPDQWITSVITLVPWFHGSNINFISKILEKAVAGQLKHYLTENKLIETYQSAYVPNKSTETALLKVQSDILNAVDSREVVFLVIPDLSAAFDTIDHGILLHCLQNNFGTSGNVLKWIRSYLESRTYQVQIDGIFSDTYDLEYGVPQGSVLGPLGFIYYTSTVGNINRKHGLKFHVYADDTQIYVSFNPRSPGACRAALRQLEHCITDLSDWMSTNMLNLNPTKTEFFIAGTSQGLQKLPSSVVLRIGDSVIKPATTVRNLGILFDAQMSMSSHIISLISSVNYHLRNIRRISKFLDQDTKHAVVHSFILSRLDYGNALLYGTKSKDLDRLQSLQHKAIKLIFSANRFESPAPLMNTLHWLPIRERINLKICIYVFKCIHGNAPKYLSDFISHRLRPVTGPIARSSNDSTLIVAHVGRNCIGDKSFYVTAPRLWNALPRNIREAKSLTVFKKMLKSHLYPKYCLALCLYFALFFHLCALI